ncbi:MAG: Cytochrome oxidase, cbb3-type, subunit [Pseudomonadota bacterium]|jgi:mono/diheme cytochrome c family protein
MSDSEKSDSTGLRARVFLIGTAATALLCGMVVLCVPGKPDVVADAAKSQALSAPQASDPQQPGAVPQTAVVAESTTAPTGPAALRAAPTGQKLYERFCAGCHGADGKAQTSMARMMSSRPTNLADGPWKGEQTATAIVEIVKNGKGAMPAYGKEISTDAELAALADYVLSLRSVNKP